MNGEKGCWTISEAMEWVVSKGNGDLDWYVNNNSIIGFSRPDNECSCSRYDYDLMTRCGNFKGGPLACSMVVSATCLTCKYFRQQNGDRHVGLCMAIFPEWANTMMKITDTHRQIESVTMAEKCKAYQKK